MDRDGTQETLRKLEENDARQTYFRYFTTEVIEDSYLPNLKTIPDLDWL